MAYATEITIGTGSKMSANYQSNEFQVSLTYQLERGDTDLAQLAEEKAAEVENLHGLIRQRVLALRQKPVVEKSIIEKSNSNKATSNGAAPPDKSENDKFETDKSETVNPPIESSSEKSSHGDPPITTAQKRVVEKLVERCTMSDEELQKLLVCRYGHNAVSNLTNRQAGLLIADLQCRIQRLTDETDKETISEPAT